MLMATYVDQYLVRMDEVQQQENLCCSICLARYVQPRTLPCSHSFCNSCLVQCLRRVQINQRFNCPFCRTDSKADTRAKYNAEEMAEQFPINFDLIQKIKTATERSSDDDSTSNYCKPCIHDKMFEPAVAYCCECSELLCSDCKKHHSKNKLTTSHTVVDMNGDDLGESRKLKFVRSLTKCKNHPLEEVKYLCKDHNQLCCNECAIVTHRKCEYLHSIGDCINSGFENRLREKLEDIETHLKIMKIHESKYKQRVCESETLIKDQLLCIKTQFEDVFSNLEKNILKQVRSKCNGLRNSVSSQQRRIDGFEAMLKRSKEKITSVEQYGHDLHMYLAEREMEKEMEQNGQILQGLSQSSNQLEISLAGKEDISDKLETILKQSLWVTETYTSTSELPHLSNFRQRSVKFVEHNRSGNRTMPAYIMENQRCKGGWVKHLKK